MQKKLRNKKLVSLLLCMMLTVAMAFGTTGCNGKGNEENAAQAQTETETETDAQTQADAQELGEGQTEFTFVVTDQDGNETQFLIHTDKETVGEALLELGLIAGDESEYGLYVKTVNGITADYDVDQTYWAFYVNGEYAEKGVDSTPVTAGDSYSFKVEK